MTKYHHIHVLVSGQLFIWDTSHHRHLLVTNHKQLSIVRRVTVTRARGAEVIGG